MPGDGQRSPTSTKMANAIKSSIAMPLILTYWLAATVISIAAMLMYDPYIEAAKLGFAPLLPFFPLLVVTGFAFSPTTNPVPIGIVLCVFVYPTFFIFLTNLTRRFSFPPVAVGLVGGIVNGVLAGACFRAMIRSL